MGGYEGIRLIFRLIKFDGGRCQSVTMCGIIKFDWFTACGSKIAIVTAAWHITCEAPIADIKTKMDGNPSPQHQHPISAQTGVCQFDGTAIAKTIHTPPLDNIIKDKGCYYYRSTATRVELNKRKGLNSNHPSCPLCPLHINLNRRNNVWTDTVTNDATATRVSRYLTPSRITTDSIYFHANAGYLTLGN